MAGPRCTRLQERLQDARLPARADRRAVRRPHPDGGVGLPEARHGRRLQGSRRRRHARHVARPAGPAAASTPAGPRPAGTPRSTCPKQVLVVFDGDTPMFISHISSGELEEPGDDFNAGQGVVRGGHDRPRRERQRDRHRADQAGRLRQRLDARPASTRSTARSRASARAASAGCSTPSTSTTASPSTAPTTCRCEPASHGCIRIPNLISPTFFNLVEHRRAGVRVRRRQGARGVRLAVGPVGLGRPELHDDDHVDDHDDHDDGAVGGRAAGAGGDAAAGDHAGGHDDDGATRRWPPPRQPPPGRPAPLRSASLRRQLEEDRSQFRRGGCSGSCGWSRSRGSASAGDVRAAVGGRPEHVPAAGASGASAVALTNVRA